MGYSGLDPEQKDQFIQDKIRSGKFILVNQHDWLTSHSAMKIPSKELMENIYMKHIIGGTDGLSKFGRYPIKGGK